MYFYGFFSICLIFDTKDIQIIFPHFPTFSWLPNKIFGSIQSNNLSPLFLVQTLSRPHERPTFRYYHSHRSIDKNVGRVHFCGRPWSGGSRNRSGRQKAKDREPCLSAAISLSSFAPLHWDRNCEPTNPSLQDGLIFTLFPLFLFDPVSFLPNYD